MREYLITLMVAAAVTYLVTPVVRRFAVRIGAMTKVRDRDVHTIPTPRLGGAAMFIGMAAALLVASRMPTLQVVNQRFSEPRALLIGGGVVFLIGALDDRFGLDAVTKLAGQILAASVMVLQGVQLLWLPIPSYGTFILGQDWSVILTVFFIVVVINAVNFIDGLDGLAAGVVGIAALAFFALSYNLAVQSHLNYTATHADRDHRGGHLPRLSAAQLPPRAGLHGRLGVDAHRPALRGVDGVADRAGEPGHAVPAIRRVPSVAVAVRHLDGAVRRPRARRGAAHEGGSGTVGARQAAPASPPARARSLPAAGRLDHVLVVGLVRSLRGRAFGDKRPPDGRLAWGRGSGCGAAPGEHAEAASRVPGTAPSRMTRGRLTPGQTLR